MKPHFFCCFFCVVGYPPNWGKWPRYIDIEIIYTKFPTTFVENIFYLDVRKGEKIFTKNGKYFYRWDATDAILRMRTDIRIDSSHDRLAHTLARLPDLRNSKSDFISPKLACYDFLK